MCDHRLGIGGGAKKAAPGRCEVNFVAGGRIEPRLDQRPTQAGPHKIQAAHMRHRWPFRSKHNHGRVIAADEDARGLGQSQRAAHRAHLVK